MTQVHAEHLEAAASLRVRFNTHSRRDTGQMLVRRGLAAIGLKVKALTRAGNAGALRILLEPAKGPKGKVHLGNDDGGTFFRLKRNESVLISVLRGQTYLPIGCADLAGVSPTRFTLQIQPGSTADAVGQAVNAVRDSSKENGAVFRIDAAPDFTSYDRQMDALLTVCGEDRDGGAPSRKRPALFEIITSTPVSARSIAAASAFPCDSNTDDTVECVDDDETLDGERCSLAEQVPSPAIEDLAAADAGVIPARSLQLAQESLGQLAAAGSLSGSQCAAIRDALTRNLTVQKILP